MWLFNNQLLKRGNPSIFQIIGRWNLSMDRFCVNYDHFLVTKTTLAARSRKAFLSWETLGTGDVLCDEDDMLLVRFLARSSLRQQSTAMAHVSEKFTLPAMVSLAFRKRSVQGQNQISDTSLVQTALMSSYGLSCLA